MLGVLLVPILLLAVFSPPRSVTLFMMAWTLGIVAGAPWLILTEMPVWPVIYPLVCAIALFIPLGVCSPLFSQHRFAEAACTSASIVWCFAALLLGALLIAVGV